MDRVLHGRSGVTPIYPHKTAETRFNVPFPFREPSPLGASPKDRASFDVLTAALTFAEPEQSPTLTC